MTRRMKATTLLTYQHDEIRTLLCELQRVCHGLQRVCHEEQSAEVLVSRLAANLIAHIVAEQEVFYPALFASAAELVREGRERQALLRFALKRLVETAPHDASFPARVTNLEALVVLHATEHRRQLFGPAERVLGGNSENLSSVILGLSERVRTAGYRRSAQRASFLPVTFNVAEVS